MAINMQQLEALLGAADISELEKVRSMLGVQGQSYLNQMPTIRGMGTGSQVGRGAYGIASALKTYGANKMSPEITQSKRDLFARLLRGMKRSPEAIPAGYYGGLENDIGD